MIDWTPERIALLESIEKVKSLRDNAARRGSSEVVERCDAEILRRNPPRIKSPRSNAQAETRVGQYVAEFHFVCPNELGVTRQQDGRFRSGTWVVSEDNAETGLKHGSVVALHASKAESSYLQGTIKGWQKRSRESRYAEDQVVKTEFGIEFLLEPMNTPLSWAGEGAGEKGYAWAPIQPA